MSRKQTLIFAAVCLAWGTTWIASDALGEQVPPLFGSAARFLLAAACCVPLLPLRRTGCPSARAVVGWILLSVTMIVLPLLLLHWARPQLPSSTVIVLYAAMPLVVILLTPVLGGGDAATEVPRAAMRASILGIGGLVLTTGAAFSAAQAGAAAVVLLAVVSTGASALLARRSMLQYHPVTVTAWVLGAAGLLLWLASKVWERGQPAQWDRRAIVWLILLAVVGALSYIAWFSLLQQVQAYRAATVQWVEPLVALAESALLLRIGFSWGMIAGALVTFASLVAVLRTRQEDDNNVSLLGI